jgi:Holliday junction DNA helicase RuvB
MSKGIRPSTFDEIIGQDAVIKRLRVSVTGCKNIGSVMPHVLIDGPPGLGKTTIASAIANEMGVNLYTTNAASIRSIKNIMPYIMGMTPRSVLFIDEIHRLPKIVEEFLYPVMEDFVLNITVKDDEDKEVAEKIDLPIFTIVGATTSGGSLSQPFYDRFTIKEHLSFYTDDDLAKLARLNCTKLNIVIDDSDLFEIAKRSKGTPRILNARLQWYRNYRSCHTDNASISEVFDVQGIDENGLDMYDRMYLNALKKSKGSPLGLKSISSMTGIAIDTIENSIEPYLVRKGYIVRTQQGRIIGNL